MRNSSRTVWITGASSGIGRALAKCFSLKGDYVVATARSHDKLLTLQSEIQASQGKCDIHTCDIQEETSIRATIEFILERHTAVDVLINNAGVTYFKSYLETSAQDFDHTIGTNLRGAFLCTKAVLPSMLEQGKGLIVNIVSFTVKSVYTQSAAYAASKAGMEAMMNVLRAETRLKGINIVNAYPGAVLTPIWHPKQQQKYASQMIHPNHVAELLYQVSIQNPSLMVEEIIIRPQTGDLQLS